MFRTFLPLTLLVAVSAFSQTRAVQSEQTLPGGYEAQNASAPSGQSPPVATTQSAAPASASTSGASSTVISFDQAVQLALANNPNLKATRTQIDQSKAEEITANLRPNPLLSGDSQFLPIFKPSQFSTDTLDSITQFDIGAGYLFERGGKRKHRLQAAQDATAVMRSQVSDAERTLTFNVAQQFINALLAKSNLNFAMLDLSSFQATVNISEERYKAGDISEGDLLKIKLQFLTFQTDVAQARVAKAQALTTLRQLLGYDSVPRDYDVAGDLEYAPLVASLDDLQAKALAERPDLRAAKLGIKAAQSQLGLARANAKQDLDLSMNYSHVSGASSASWFFNIPLPFFNRNQGEIKRTLFAVDQSSFAATSAEEGVIADVRNAWEAVSSNNEIVKLYTSGYLKQAQDSRDISDYAYKGGAATLLDLLDAERSYRTTQLGYRQALAAYMLSLEQLRQAVGVRSLP